MTDQLVILGSRAWFLDIRDGFLDCAGLEHASQTPPTPPPEVGTQTAAVDTPPEAPASPPEPAVNAHTTPPGQSSRRPSMKALAQVSSAFSAAKAATKEGTSRMSSSLSAKGRSLGKVTTTTATGASASAVVEKSDGSVQGGGDVGSGRAVAMPGVSISMPGLFKRASRTATEKQQPSDSDKPATEQPSLLSPRGNSSVDGGEDGRAWAGDDQAPRPSAVKVGAIMGRGGTNLSKLPGNEERERSDLFGGSFRSPSVSPCARSPSAAASRSGTYRGTFLAADGGSKGAGIKYSAETRSSSSGAVAASASPLPSTAAGPGGRKKEKRAFAGGLWGGSGSSGAGARGNPAQTVGLNSENRPVATIDEAVAVAGTSHSAESGVVGSDNISASVPSFSSDATTKPRPSRGKRRFAGGGLSGPQPASAQPSAVALGAVESDNPFVAGSGHGGSGDGGGSKLIGSRAGAMHGSSFAADQKALAREQAPNLAPSRNAEPSVPAWAAESIPEWATGSEGGGANNSGGGDGYRPSNGPGLAPPSRPEQVQHAAANQSPFMKVEPEAPPGRRPSQRRPGESGSRRAFGGGERLF